MIDPYTQVGVSGIFVVILLRLIFDFLKDWRRSREDKAINGSTDIKRVLSIVKNLHEWDQKAMPLLKELHTWHDVVDNDGVKIWYVRWSLETAISKLADNLLEQTKILQQMTNEMINVKRVVESFKKD